MSSQVWNVETRRIDRTVCPVICDRPELHGRKWPIQKCVRRDFLPTNTVRIMCAGKTCKQNLMIPAHVLEMILSRFRDVGVTTPSMDLIRDAYERLLCNGGLQ